MSFPGGIEWILILLIVVVLFGAKKIPDLMKGLGTGIKEFKKAANTDDENNDKSNDPKSVNK